MSTPRVGPRRAGASRAILTAASVLLIAAGAAGDAPATDRVRRVLVVHSYSPFRPFTQHQSRGIEDAVGQASDLKVQLFHEHLNAEAHGSADDLHARVSALRAEYAGHRFDAIITTDAIAFDWFQQYRDLLWPETPLIFSGLSSLPEEPDWRRGEVTGVCMQSRPIETVRAALQMRPRTRRVYAISLLDAPVEQLRRALHAPADGAAPRPDIEVQGLPGGTDTFDAVTRVPADSIIVFMSHLLPRSEVDAAPGSALAAICRQAAAPVFVLFDIHLQDGAVGGLLTSGIALGETAAGLALRVLRGESASAIPVIEHPPHEWVFAWGPMRRWGIAESALPAPHEILGRAPTFWARYRWHIAAVAGFMLIQMLLIAQLLRARRRTRRAADALAESERMFREVAAGIDECVIVSDIDERRLVYLSPGYERIFGRSIERALQDPLGWRDMLHPADRPRVEAAMEELYRSGRLDISYRLTTPDGHARWIEERGYPLPVDVQGRRRVVRLSRDVTARRALEQAVREGAERLRMFVEHTPAAVAMFDGDMRYIAHSRRWLSDYKLGDEPLIGRSHYDVFPEIGEAWKAVHRRCMSGAVEHAEQDRFERADGRVDWLRWEVRPWREAAGAIGGIIMFTEVITQRKRAEEIEAGRSRMLEQLTGGASQSELLDGILRFAESQCPGMRAGILLMDADGRCLRRGAAPSLPEEFVAAVDGLPVGPQVGCCGAAAFHKRRVVVADIESDPKWTAFRPLARRCGLRACWSSPIMDPRGEVLGTLACYYGDCRSPDDAETAVLDSLTHMAALAIGRTRAAEALQRSESRYRMLVENVPVIAWEAHPGGFDFAYVSGQAERLSGFTPAEWLKPGFWASRVHPDDLQAAIEFCTAATARCESHEFEYRFITAGDRVIWLHDIVAVERREGRPPLVYGVIVDITQQKQAVEALSESEERYRSLVENSRDATFLHDGERFVFANPATARLLGFEDEQAILGRPISESLAPESREIVRQRVAQLLSGALRELPRIELMMRRSDGAFVPVEAWASACLLGGRLMVQGTLLDITERRAAEQAQQTAREELERRVIERTAALSEANQRLQDALDEVNDLYHHAPCGYHSLDPDGAIVRMNDTELSWLGYERGEVVGRMTMRDLLAPESRVNFDAVFSRFRETGHTRGLELQLLRRDGTVMSALLNATAIRDADGRFLRSRSTLFDITELKGAQDRLRESEERLSFAQRCAQAGAWEWETATGRYYWSDEYYELCGLEPGSIEPSHASWRELVCPVDRTSIMARLQKLLESRDTQFFFEYRLLHPVLGLRWVADVGQVLRDADGRANRLVGMLIDISKQKLAEQNLRLIRSAIEHFGDGVIITERDAADGQPRIVYANPAMAGLAGREVDGLVGRSPRVLIGEQTDVEQFAAIGPIADRGERFEMETVGYRRIGSSFMMHCSVAPIFDESLAVSHWVWLIKDVTDMRRAEEQTRRQTAELARMGRLITMGEMAAGLAHELNQPLTAIANYAAGMARRLQDSDEPLRRVLQSIHTEADRAGDIIRGLRRFVRRQEPRATAQDLNDLVREAATLIAADVRQQGIELRLDLREGLPNVTLDRVQIQQVVLNLTRNAIEAMVGHATRQRLLCLRTEAQNGSVSLHVEDSGPGLCADAESRLFEQMFSTKRDGLGVGLWLSRAIVEANGGVLTAARRSAGGMDFSVTMPAAH